MYEPLVADTHCDVCGCEIWGRSSEKGAVLCEDCSDDLTGRRKFLGGVPLEEVDWD